ncbi:MAG: type IX secretion system sortase PorU [Bacteroidia bacterium]|nr:type IX secretion system sortase PorU [Bacteroidia bacterium]
MARWLWLGSLIFAQTHVWDSYVPELPPYTLTEVEGSHVLDIQGAGLYRDSSGDFQQWAARIPWQDGQEWYPAAPIFLSELLMYKKRFLQHLFIYKWQIHRSGHRLRIWIELPSYQLRAISAAASFLRTATFAPSSVLATGRWYKLATGSQGIYRVTSQVLRRLGIDPAGVDPRQLRLYGQRGGLLPQSNAETPPDDLVEIPLFFPGEGDGRWDEGDVAYFWAEGPDSWYPLSGQPNRPYFHLKNPYADSCYYFLTFDMGGGRRIDAASPPPGPHTPRSQGMLLFFHERELTNILKSGRVWLGENLNSLSSSISIPFSLPAFDSVYVRIQYAASSFTPSQLNLSWAGTSLGTFTIPAIPGPADSYQAMWGQVSRVFYNTSANPVLSLTYAGSGQGYLDYVELVGWHKLIWEGGQYVFHIPAGGPWQVQVLSSSVSAPFVWDVTDGVTPRLVTLLPFSGGFAFLSAGDTLRRYCAFSTEAASEVRIVGPVGNQNLHALRGVRLVVATTPEQAPLAQRFCDLHPEAGPCVVVTPEQLYNEFSGGRPDICALRNFLRMLYLRASSPQEQPQHLLIVGAASYNFREKAATLFPTYQSRESFHPPSSYGSDDFFGFLDNTEGFWGEGGAASWYDPRDRTVQSHLLDIGITRLPTYSVSDLEIYLEKLTDYLQNPLTRGSWLQKFVIFSDYKDGGRHTSQAEQICAQLSQDFPHLDLVKIYLDRYPAQPRASGLVFPAAREALLAQLNQGAFIAHYVGHGNEYTLQGFEFFPISTVRQIQNYRRYLFFVTATCDWGKWDAPSIRSGGIEALFLPQRGAIGMLTSTRKVFSDLNFALSRNFYTAMASMAGPQRMVFLSDLMRDTKNRSWSSAGAINSRSFSFLGDPLLPLGLPMYKVVVTHLGSGPPSASQPDTLRPLRSILLRGEIRDSVDALVSDFQGEITIRLWDKPLNRQTLINRTTFTSQEILLFSGTASVRNGVFEIRFHLPVDIIPEPGLGKASFWAQAGDGRTAAGAENRFVVCCPDSTLPPFSPPLIRLFINDTTWVSGSWTDPNPLLLAYLYDSLGINLSSLAIGRELKATLNDKEYFLSTYYQGKRDRPNEGKVEYRFTDLPEGEYRLRLRAYNLAGQEGTAETSFIVAERGRLKIGRLFNYPNPFTTSTRFVFEHNQPGQPLEARVLIYTVSGRLIQTLYAPIVSHSNLCQEIVWDGLDSYGDRLARGVYIYRLEIRNPATGEAAYAQEKLVLLR